MAAVYYLYEILRRKLVSCFAKVSTAINEFKRLQKQYLRTLI